MPPCLAELWPSRLRGRFNGLMMSFFAFGIALSPVWALVFLPSVGWPLALTAPFALLTGAGGTLPPIPPAAPVRQRDIAAPGILPVTLMLWLLWFTEYGVLHTFQSVLPSLLAMDGFSIVRSTQLSVVIFSGFVPGYTALLFLPRSTLVAVALTKGCPDQSFSADNEAAVFLGHIGRTIYDHFMKRNDGPSAPPAT